jgi:hypothetical protein
MIKLCYKEYDFKVNLAACKSFYEQTGTDLQHTLLLYLDANVKSVGQGLLERMTTYHGVCKFDIAAKLMHCLIKQKHDGIPLAEIEDAMFRVSWTPTEQTTELCEPWPLVMLGLATQVNDYFADNLPKKKADTSEKAA